MASAQRACGSLSPPLLQCGYLYLSDPQRLHDMMGLLGLGDAPQEGGGSGGSSGDGDGSSASARSTEE